jgi:transcriptional antiterminator
MSNKNNIIKSELLSLYKKGKNADEAHEEISKSHSSYNISLEAVNKWYNVFKPRVSNSTDYIASGAKKKLTDEYLISLVKDNPNLNTIELASLAGVSKQTISRRLRQLNIDGKTVSYSKKSIQKFTDEYIIDLVNKNPKLSMTELSRIAGTSDKTIANRIKQINSEEERITYNKKPRRSKKDDSSVSNPEFEDEYLIKLINTNPDLSLEKLASLTGSSRSVIAARIKKINLHNERVNYQRKDVKKFTDRFLADLVTENPDFNQEELSIFTGTSGTNVSSRLNEANNNGKGTYYVTKNDIPKFTDGFLIDLVNKNPGLNMTELAEIAGVSFTTISRRIKEIINSGANINYINKKTKKDIAESYENLKLTDEYLIDLVNENPDLNMTELAKNAGASRIIISQKIKKINTDGERVNYVNKHRKTKSNINNTSKSTLTDAPN